MRQRKNVSFWIFANLRWAVIIIPVMIFITVVCLSVISGDTFLSLLYIIFEKLIINCGWMISLGCLMFVLFMIYGLFSPIGNIKFGGKDAKPQYSTWNWWAISLCAGIGTGIVFWGAAEPLMFALSPAPGMNLTAGSNEAVIWAMRTAFMHWSFTPYAIYVTFGIMIGYAYYNMKKPYCISVGFITMKDEKVLKTKFASMIDSITIFAIIGGVSNSLAFGLLQLGEGLNMVFNIEPRPLVWIIIASIIVVSYEISSISGLDQGIKWLSDKNAWMFIVLMGIFLVCGPTSYIFNLGTQSFGSFINNFIEGMTFTDPFNGSELWPQWWDMYYWTWWLSFGPMIGLFLIKLCYGRTIREFIIVNWILPASFGILWFSVFGGFALDLQLNQKIDIYGYMLLNGTQSIMLKLYDYLPFTQALRIFALIITFISFVTMADSLTSTISLMSINKSESYIEAPMSIKLFWGILMGAMAAVLTLSEGIDQIKIIGVLTGFPILFLGISMLVNFLVYFIRHPRDVYGNYIEEKALYNEALIKENEVIVKNLQGKSKEIDSPSTTK